MLAANTILQGRYRIIQQLGRGGMGAVYQAMDENLSCLVAVKETFATTEGHRRAFEREAKLLANLTHPALPRVMDHFAQESGQFLVMQFIPGHDLAELLFLRERPFPLAKVSEWADRLLDALEELHSYNPPIVHRDIKPSNLKLTPKGKIILLDFGLAKGAAGQMSTVDAESYSQSVYGYTRHYAPLEQMRGAGTDPRSDLYSLAATLWTLLTAETPPDALARVSDKEDGSPDPLRLASEINQEIPQPIAAVLNQALSLNRNGRFASAAAMREALREATEQAQAEAAAAEQERQRKEEAAGLAVAERIRQEIAAALAEGAERRKLEEDERHKREAAERQRAAEEEQRRQREQAVERLRRQLSGLVKPQPGDEAEEGASCLKEEAAPRREEEFVRQRAEELERLGRELNDAAKRPPVDEAEEATREAERKRAPRAAAEMTAPTSPASAPRVAARHVVDKGAAARGEALKRDIVEDLDRSLVAAKDGRRRRSMLIAVVGLLTVTVIAAIVWWALTPNLVGEAPAANTAGKTQAGPPTKPTPTPTNPNQPSPPTGMVYVPGGTFMMGQNGRGEVDQYERPAHSVTVKPFFLDMYEVTNEEYAKFIKATDNLPPPTWTDKTYPEGASRKPVTGVTWDDARAYAAWAGKRLPTEEEWEFAARGRDGRTYPWGNDWSAGLANADGASNGMADVGAYKGASPFGAFDMVGNAWEWTDSKLIPYPGGSLPIKVSNDVKVIRGGTHSSNPSQATTTYRRGWRASGEEDYSNTGFRCVRDIEPQQ